jgi:hypothetical protein
MIIYIITAILGFLVGVLSTVGLAAYYYYKGVHEAHQDGWDMPS